ncbi:Protein MAIN-LIKE 1 [Linum perenne]
MLPLLEDIDRVGEYAWGAATLSWLYRELGRTAFRIESGTTAEHIGDIGGWLALLQVWALEIFPSIARRVHSKRKKRPDGRTISRLPEYVEHISFKVRAQYSLQCSSNYRDYLNVGGRLGLKTSCNSSYLLDTARFWTRGHHS